MPSSQTNATLLVLDDDELVCNFVATVAEGIGYDVVRTTSFDDFRDQYFKAPPVGMVLDLRLGGNDGIQVLRFLSAQGAQSRITLLSGMDSRTLDSAKQLAANLGLNIGSALEKPVRADTLREALRPPKSIEPTVTIESLHRALANDEFYLEYQPVVRCIDSELIGVEALIRWLHPQRGRVPPDAFIPVAEDHVEVIDGLTLWVAARVAEDLPKLRNAGFSGRVAINVSAHNLRRLDFPERLADLMTGQGMSAACIKLEVTETVAMTDPLAVLNNLLRLRIKGFELSIDDFGTGYSSLLMLQRLPYSELKIDRSFIGEVETSTDAAAIVQAVLGMAQTMKLTTVAEGVESRHLLPVLAGLGADFAQGYGISRPVPIDALVNWIATESSTRPT